MSTELIRAATETVNALRARARAVELAGDVYLASWLRHEASRLDAVRTLAEVELRCATAERTAERLYHPERSTR